MREGEMKEIQREIKSSLCLPRQRFVCVTVNSLKLAISRQIVTAVRPVIISPSTEISSDTRRSVC